jgi:hypothetical protein
MLVEQPKAIRRQKGLPQKFSTLISSRAPPLDHPASVRSEAADFFVSLI